MNPALPTPPTPRRPDSLPEASPAKANGTETIPQPGSLDVGHGGEVRLRSSPTDPGVNYPGPAADTAATGHRSKPLPEDRQTTANGQIAASDAVTGAEMADVPGPDSK